MVGKTNQSILQSPQDPDHKIRRSGSRYRKATQSRNEKIVKRNIWLFAVSLTISWSPLVFFHFLRFLEIDLQQNICTYLYKMTSIVPYLRLDLNYFSGKGTTSCPKYHFQPMTDRYLMIIFQINLAPF